MPGGNCGAETDGRLVGSKNNGSCSSGGCNKRNVFDWLADIPLSDQAAPFDIVEVSFKQGSRKEFYKNTTHQLLNKGVQVVVEGVGGFDIGEVSLSGELVRLQLKRKKVKDTSELGKILRLATESDLEKLQANKKREKEMLIRSRILAGELGLQMKVTEIEMQADGKKATFYYTADSRVDFRQLIRSYASEFHVKVEMRQIGARQEAARLGGIGSCGRELCCSSWMTEFKSVNTAAARYQNLSINQSKLSGLCGRLKCCLNFELDTYLDALKHFPEDAGKLETKQGTAYLQKKDIFKELMWYSFKENHIQYPLSIERVLEIKELNKKGIAAEELEPVVLESKNSGETEHSFVDVVGQISLNALDNSDRRRKRQNRGKKFSHRGGNNRNRNNKRNQRRGN